MNNIIYRDDLKENSIPDSYLYNNYCENMKRMSTSKRHSRRADKSNKPSAIHSQLNGHSYSSAE